MPELARFHVQGMDCADEVAAIRAQLAGLPGVGDLEFDLLQSRLGVTYDPAVLSADDIVQRISALGLKTTRWREATAAEPPASWWSVHGRATLAGLSGVLIAAAFAGHAVAAGSFGAALRGEATPAAAIGLYILAALAGAWLVLPRAVVAVRRLRPDMHLLMCVAVVGAMILGDWFEAATVSFLFATALWLEQASLRRTRRAIGALLDLSPKVARQRVEPGGAVEERPVDEIAPGSVVIVRPGEKLPLDGTVETGRSHVNEASLTGESRPVARGPGEAVYAGTINGDALLEIRTTRPASDTALARMVHMVQEAQSRRSVRQQWIEQFALVYTPAMLVLALVLALVPPLVFSQSWSDWFYRALVLLVIACPCALVISTPVSIVSALTSAMRRGILIKGGAALETAASLNVVALDKTGTVTFGRPEVQEIVPLNGHSPTELLERAAALEVQSRHPLAQAIVRRAQGAGLSPAPATEFRELQGRGASGLIGGREFWIGSPRLLVERGGVTEEIAGHSARMEASGHSVVVIGNAAHVCGLLTVADQVRPGARESLNELRRAGVEKVILLTGDARQAAASVAREVGADEFRAELLPAEKLAAIEELVSSGRNVAMVGDGVNDAPALARATLGIAMAAAGSDAAIETADVALMSDDLPSLAWLIRHARRTVRVIQQNIAFSLGVKLLFLALALAGRTSLWLAIAADTGATLVVIANSLRLLNQPRE